MVHPVVVEVFGQILPGIGDLGLLIFPFGILDGAVKRCVELVRV